MNQRLIEQARRTDMIAFLEQYSGFTFAQRGSGYRCKQHSSLAVKADRLSWYWHSKNTGGFGLLDYLINVENMTFNDAMQTALNDCKPAPKPTFEPENPFCPPERGDFLQGRVLGYLCKKRGLECDIVAALMEDGKIYEDKRGNVVFVGFDENRKPRFASLRGTGCGKPFRMDCPGSDKQYGFCMAYSEAKRLYAFESPIDAISHATIENIIQGDSSAWKQDNRLSLAGTSDIALPFFLNQHPAKEIVLCLDNDEVGRKAAVAIARKYSAQGYSTRIELPRGKDYNVDLMAYRMKHRHNSIEAERMV